MVNRRYGTPAQQPKVTENWSSDDGFVIDLLTHRKEYLLPKRKKASDKKHTSNYLAQIYTPTKPPLKVPPLHKPSHHDDEDYREYAEPPTSIRTHLTVQSTISLEQQRTSKTAPPEYSPHENLAEPPQPPVIHDARRVRVTSATSSSVLTVSSYTPRPASPVLTSCVDTKNSTDHFAAQPLSTAGFFDESSDVSGSFTVRKMVPPPQTSMISEEVVTFEAAHGCLTFTSVALCVICGLVGVTTVKWMTLQVVPKCEHCSPHQFQAPCIQSLFMFLAESLCLVLFYILRLCASPDKMSPWIGALIGHGVGPEQYSAWWWVSPSFLDFFGTSLCNAAYTYTHASTVQLMRNMIVIVMAICQALLIRRPLRLHEWLGVLVITGSLVLTAVTGSFGDAADVELHNGARQPYFGIVLVVVGTSITAMQVIWEEFLYMKGSIPPMQAVGIEGVAGAYFALAVLPMVHEGKIEDVLGSFYQIGVSTALWVAAILLICSTFIFTLTGLMVTRVVDARLRSLIFVSRTPMVAIAEVSIGWPSSPPVILASATLMFLIGFWIYTDWFPIDRVECLQHPVACCGYEDLFEEEESQQTTRPTTGSMAVFNDSSQSIPYNAAMSQSYEDSVAVGVRQEKFNEEFVPQPAITSRTQFSTTPKAAPKPQPLPISVQSAKNRVTTMLAAKGHISMDSDGQRSLTSTFLTYSRGSRSQTSRASRRPILKDLDRDTMTTHSPSNFSPHLNTLPTPTAVRHVGLVRPPLHGGRHTTATDPPISSNPPNSYTTASGLSSQGAFRPRSMDHMLRVPPATQILSSGGDDPNFEGGRESQLLRFPDDLVLSPLQQRLQFSPQLLAGRHITWQTQAPLSISQEFALRFDFDPEGTNSDACHSNRDMGRLESELHPSGGMVSRPCYEEILYEGRVVPPHVPARPPQPVKSKPGPPILRKPERPADSLSVRHSRRRRGSSLRSYSIQDIGTFISDLPGEFRHQVSETMFRLRTLNSSQSDDSSTDSYSTSSSSKTSLQGRAFRCSPSASHSTSVFQHVPPLGRATSQLPTSLLSPRESCSPRKCGFDSESPESSRLLMKNISSVSDCETYLSLVQLGRQSPKYMETRRHSSTSISPGFHVSIPVNGERPNANPIKSADFF